MHTDQAEYQAAKDRVDNTPELTKFSEFILADWNDEWHWEWVVLASVSTIVNWCEVGIVDDELDALEAEVLDAAELEA